jgi:hypothetical protein
MWSHEAITPWRWGEVVFIADSAGFPPPALSPQKARTLDCGAAVLDDLHVR